MMILLLSQSSVRPDTIHEVLSRISGLKLEVVKNLEEASMRVAEKDFTLVLSNLNQNCDVAA